MNRDRPPTDSTARKQLAALRLSRSQGFKVAVLVSVSIASSALFGYWHPKVFGSLPIEVLAPLAFGLAVATLAFDLAVLLPILRGHNPPTYRVVLGAAGTIALAALVT